MKGVLFFLGSIFRWPVQNSKEFLILHVYLLGIYGITFLLRNLGLEAVSYTHLTLPTNREV